MKPTIKLGPTDVLYFGCLDQPGHFLHFRQIRDRELFDMTPWGTELDSKLLVSAKVPDNPNGVTALFQRDGWTAVAFWDRSVDSRPGSNSAFLVHALVTKEELLQMARKQWPGVWEQPGFPLGAATTSTETPASEPATL